jgi:hypothetical protein
MAKLRASLEGMIATHKVGEKKEKAESFTSNVKTKDHRALNAKVKPPLSRVL